MDNERVISFEKAPEEGVYRCMSCGHLLDLKPGQLVPPCPKCGFREFARTEGGVCC